MTTTNTGVPIRRRGGTLLQATFCLFLLSAHQIAGTSGAVPPEALAAVEKLFDPAREATIAKKVDCETGPNIFMIWPGAAELFLVDAFGTLESTLFHHPDANVFVLNLPKYGLFFM